MARLDRFLRLEKRQPASQGHPPALASPERFGAEPAPEERPLHVLPDDPTPFVRCCVCRADSHPSALTCPNCGSDLGTPVQRAFNQVLAREYEKRRAEERVQADEVRAAQVEAEREARAAQRRAFDSLLDMARRSASTEAAPPVGLRLARRIRNPALRLIALVSAAALPLALVLGGARPVGLLLMAVVAAAFVPWRPRRGFWEG